MILLKCTISVFVVDIKFRLLPEEYEPFLSSEAKLQCTVYATVKETKQMWLGKATQCFAPPRIRSGSLSGSQFALVGTCVVYISVTCYCGELYTGEPFTVKLEFTNPLSIPLTELKWVIEGSGLIKGQVVDDQHR